MLDVLYLSWNRIEFTEQTLPLLLANTDWSDARLVVYDDGSEAHAVERLTAILEGSPAEFIFNRTHYRSPVAVMCDYLFKSQPTEIFAKIDNDVCVPPGWLDSMLEVFTPKVELLGMEVGHPNGIEPIEPPETEHVMIPARHIGGVGLMRTSAFTHPHRKAPKPVGRFGFTEWQHTYQPVRGWIFPDLPVPCLDRIPTEPWLSLSLFYEQAGWQRPWWKYPVEASCYWEWMEEGVAI